MPQKEMKEKSLDAVEMQDACICKVQMCVAVQYTKLIQTKEIIFHKQEICSKLM